MIKAPCKDCDDRHFKCHGECDKYKEFVAQNALEKKELTKYAELNEVRKDRQTKEMKFRKGRYK